VENWALFERDEPGFEALGIESGRPEDDPEFQQALQTLAIKLV